MSKKLVEAIESGDPIMGPSMGCKVAEPVCSVPGCDGGIAPSIRYDPDDYSKVQFISFGLVPAPKCGTCKAPMEYTKRATDWACQDAVCPGFDVPVSTGIGGVIG